MKHSTVKQFTALQAALGKTYGVQDVTEAFSVSPTHEQTLHDKIEESSEFLQQINVIGVRDKVGEKVMGGVSGPLIARTKTSAGDRKPREIHNLDSQGYALFKTESDVAIPYALLDQWSKFPDFYERLQKWVNHRKALDRIMVGWHGTSVAEQTDLTANPLGQDVNKGWLQLLRERAASQILTEGEKAAGKIQLGSAGDFKTLDALVADVKQGIDHKFRGEGDLVALIGEDLLGWDEGKLYATHGNTPTEKAGIQMATKSYGGLPSLVNVPYFPATGLVVTSLSNLSIYWQEESNRRSLKDNPKRDRIEDYHSRNEGYVVEEVEKMAAIEAGNVQLL